MGTKAKIHAVQAHAAAIRGVGLRVTQPRVAVLSVLTKAAGPLSHGDFVDALAGQGFDRVTRAVRERSVEVTLRGLCDRCS